MLEKISINDVYPSDYNPRRISNDEFNKLSKNINEFGLVDPLIINLKNNRIIGGHQRYDVLVENGIEELLLLKRGDIGLAFLDEDLTIESEDREKALNLALNRISGEWDETKLTPLLEEFELKNFDLELTGFDDLELEELDINVDFQEHNNLDPDTSEDFNDDDDKYTDLHAPLVYEVKGDTPIIEDLIDTSKTDELQSKIENSNIPEEIKEFLKFSSYRHLKFNYSKIAEFYAHQDKDVQELMEDSALVIIDFDKAIEKGYVSFDKKIQEIIKEEREYD